MLKSFLLATILAVPYHISNAEGIEDVINNYYGDSQSNVVCPGLFEGTPRFDEPLQEDSIPTLEEYNEALKGLDIMSVIKDIQNFVLRDSRECWPADSFNDKQSYGPLFIRLAWHCSGTFRATDGAGGCAGGRQRFSPEASWGDNTNLDKARALLAPIKQIYGAALSWGDLMVFAGTAAILDMEGPVSEICAGRIDDFDGAKSRILGPSEEAPPCPDPQSCPEPFGPEEIGDIYVNPEGFRGIPEPSDPGQAKQLRRIFGRMGMNDRETVSLIGGGHAFGRTHGACPDGAGPNPEEAPEFPWPGKCGTTGRGSDTFTSGLEGPWTSEPLQWDNQFFTLLNEHGMHYSVNVGSGGRHQWRHPTLPLIMLTPDLVLIYDEKYDEIVDEFARDIGALNIAFAHAWAKLTTQGAGWAQERQCVQVNQLLDNAEDADPCINNNGCINIRQLSIKRGRFNGEWTESGKNRNKPSYKYKVKKSEYNLFYTKVNRQKMWVIVKDDGPWNTAGSGFDKNKNGYCTQSVLSDCDGEWRCGPGRDSNVKFESCSAFTMEEHLVCIENEHYDGLYVYNNGSIWSGTKKFELDHTECLYNKAIYTYSDSEDNWYYLHYDEYYKHSDSKELSVRWVISVDVADSSAQHIAYCDQSEIIECIEGQWTDESMAVTGTVAEKQNEENIGSDKSAIAAVVTSFLIIVIVAVGLCLFYWRKNKALKTLKGIEVTDEKIDDDDQEKEEIEVNVALQTNATQ